MEIRKHIVGRPLADLIQHIVYVSGSLPIPYLKELPDGGINLVIELNENTRNTIFSDPAFQSRHEVRHAWISGTQKQAILYKNNPDSAIISIRFAAGGFFALTGIPITALEAVGTEAEDLLGSSFRHLYQRVINAATIPEKFRLIENYFLRYSLEGSMERDIVRFVGQNIDKPIDWLIRKSGYSQKHVIHLLKKHTGFSPKYLQRLHRFHRAAADIQRQGNKTGLFSVVSRHGYYDHAHLIKDFFHFSGINPTEYLDYQLGMEKARLLPDMIFKPPANMRSLG